MINLLHFIQINCLEWFLKIIREMHLQHNNFIIAVLKLYSVLGPGNVFLHCL